MVKTYSHAEVQGQRLVCFEDREETNGRTDGGDCITYLANAAVNKFCARTGLFEDFAR